MRAHLRECEECAGFARSQRAQRGALRALGAIPLPSSLAGLFGGGGGAAVGTGVAVKAAVFATGAVVATGVGYETVKQGPFHNRAAATPVAAKAHRAATKPPSGAAAVIPAVPQRARDEKPFRRATVKARNEQHQQIARAVALGHAKPKPVKEVSVLPPSRVRSHDLKPTHVRKPPPARKPPPHVKKPPPANKGPTGAHGPSGRRGPTGEHGKSSR